MVKIEAKAEFMKYVKQGISLLLGAGFSIGAKDSDGKNLPLGSELLTEIQEEFPSIKAFSNLSMASTVLERTHKQNFYDFLERRFKVSEYDEAYKVLPLINVKNIYTTNIDDLIYSIYDG